jgi:Tfp pilus assembly protein PilN
MRAVNLLPSDMRGAAPKAPRAEKAEGIGAFVLLGALALSVAALAGYVLTTNEVKQKQADLVSAQQQASAAQAKAAALRPYADYEALAQARVATVKGLAAARFDWEQALGDLSRAVPGDVKLKSLNGDMGLPGATGNGSDPLRGSIAAPAITLTGCAPTQSGVARMMSRIRAVDGVTRVALSKSVKEATSAATGSATESPCGKGTPPTFSLVAFFERSKVLEALSEGGVDTGTAVLVPNAVSGTTGTADAGTGAAATDGSATTPPATDAPAPTADAAGATPTSTTGTTP